ncbi:hypothetical protein [Aeropyrum camini]|uniref:thiolase family protein n=1 Tax=Aeropyrum camini TaxID=229980 RepID=UPI00210CE574|nr:hypothetical protein [Aeropyrum camini]
MATARAGVLRSPVYIVDGVRTPVGKFGRSLRDFKAVDLAALTIRELLERTSVDPSHVELAVYGHVIRAGTHMNTAKQAAIKAELRNDVEGFTSTWCAPVEWPP